MGGATARGESLLNLDLTQKGRTIVDLTYSYTDDYKKSGPKDGLEAVNVDEQSIYIKGSYGIMNQTTIELLAPYRMIELKEVGLDEAGFGDLELMANLRIPIKKKCWVAAGFSLPTGESDTEDVEGELINASLQQGRGASDFIIGFSHLHNFGKKVMLYNDTRVRCGLYENSSDYRYGTMVDSTIGGSLVLGRFDLFVDFFWSYSESDRKNGSKVEDSGGDMFFLTPGIRYWIVDDMAVSIKSQFLIAEQAKGEQMIPEYIISIGVTAMWGGK